MAAPATRWLPRVKSVNETIAARHLALWPRSHRPTPNPQVGGSEREPRDAGPHFVCRLAKLTNVGRLSDKPFALLPHDASRRGLHELAFIVIVVSAVDVANRLGLRAACDLGSLLVQIARRQLADGEFAQENDHVVGIHRDSTFPIECLEHSAGMLQAELTRMQCSPIVGVSVAIFAIGPNTQQSRP